MEKRMIKFGNSSLALIVPKKWVERNGLTPSDSVNVLENSNGDLVISSREEPVKEREELIGSDIGIDAVKRLVGLHYMFGTTKLRLYFREGIGKTMEHGINDMVKEECPGFEIISHSDDDVVIEDFNNVRDVDLWKILSRIRLIIGQEFDDVRKNDVKALQDSENLVNRFYMLGVRRLNTLGTEDSTRYFVLFQMLEMISDNLCLMCRDGAFGNVGMLAKLEEQFNLCFSGLDGNSDAVRKAIAIRDAIFDSAHSLRIDKLRMHAVQEITNEISRISEFGLYLKPRHP
jgi:phosphate uptake regulator